MITPRSVRSAGSKLDNSKAISRFIALCILSIAACDTKFVEILDQGSATQESPSPDMSQPQAKCAAAKGLGGDNLFCIDFSQVTDPYLLNNNGWEVTCSPGALWEIVEGKMQVQNFEAFKQKSCQFKLPAISSNDFEKYEKFTLTILHTLNILETNQSAAVYLEFASPDQQLWKGVGKNLRQSTTIAIGKQVVPKVTTYQPYFQITAINNAIASGWQIESIAIQGSK